MSCASTSLFLFSFSPFLFPPQNVLVKTKENNDDDDDYNGKKGKKKQKQKQITKPMKCTVKNTHSHTRRYKHGLSDR